MYAQFGMLGVKLRYPIHPRYKTLHPIMISVVGQANDTDMFSNDLLSSHRCPNQPKTNFHNNPSNCFNPFHSSFPHLMITLQSGRGGPK